MPVPASYNDVTEDKAIRDHVGLVWYDRTFYVPEAWRQSSLVWLRFGSVHYAAQVVSIIMPHHVSKVCSSSADICHFGSGFGNFFLLAFIMSLLLIRRKK
jgi:hypothetical protein